MLGIAGSVAVGKSATAGILRELLSRWPGTPRVELVTTDGFLLPNAERERRGLLQRKGFPESYDRRALLRFVSDVNVLQPARYVVGRQGVTVPCGCWETALSRPEPCVHRYAALSDDDSVRTAGHIWRTINERSLVENILPTRPRATLVLTKGADHDVQRIRLRKL